MEKLLLTEEQKKELVAKTNEMLFDLDMLNADMQGLRDVVSSFNALDAFVDKDYKHTRLIYENALLKKYQEANELRKAIDENKTKLGIKTSKKRRRKLTKNKTL